MSQATLSAAATDLIEIYGKTAKNMVQAYRAGNQRVAGFVDAGWNRAFEQSRDQLTAEVRKNAQHAHDTVGRYFHKGLELATGSADALVDKLVAFSVQGVSQAAANAARFDAQIGVAAFDKLAQAAVPAFAAVNKLASQLEQGSGQFAARVAGEPTATKASAFAKARARRAA